MGGAAEISRSTHHQLLRNVDGGPPRRCYQRILERPLSTLENIVGGPP
jgi:hypothetical protein